MAETLEILDSDCDNSHMRITAKADYAVRAALELAAAPEGEPVKGERLAEAQEIPLQFLEHILLELKHARLVKARRGAAGVPPAVPRPPPARPHAARARQGPPRGQGWILARPSRRRDHRRRRDSRGRGAAREHSRVGAGGAALHGGGNPPAGRLGRRSGEPERRARERGPRGARGRPPSLAGRPGASP